MITGFGLASAAGTCGAGLFTVPVISLWSATRRSRRSTASPILAILALGSAWARSARSSRSASLPNCTAVVRLDSSTVLRNAVRSLASRAARPRMAEISAAVSCAGVTVAAGGKASFIRPGMRAAPAAPPRPADSPSVAASSGKRDLDCAGLAGAGLAGAALGGAFGRSRRKGRSMLGAGSAICAAGGNLISGADDSEPSLREISIWGVSVGGGGNLWHRARGRARGRCRQGFAGRLGGGGVGGASRRGGRRCLAGRLLDVVLLGHGGPPDNDSYQLVSRLRLPIGYQAAWPPGAVTSGYRFPPPGVSARFPAGRRGAGSLPPRRARPGAPP